MALTASTSLAEIATTNPSLTRELAGLPVAAEPATDWMGLPPEAMADHLEATHHQFLKRELSRLSKLATKVSRVHGDKHTALVEAAEVLFPMIGTLASATPVGPASIAARSAIRSPSWSTNTRRSGHCWSGCGRSPAATRLLRTPAPQRGR